MQPRSARTHCLNNIPDTNALPTDYNRVTRDRLQPLDACLQQTVHSNPFFTMFRSGNQAPPPSFR